MIIRSGEYRRRNSFMLQKLDYSWNGAYFITICTHCKNHYFGNVIQGEMHLSEIGLVAKTCWEGIREHAIDVELGSFVIMPNHIHGILILHGNPYHLRENNNLTGLTPGQKRLRNQGKNTVSSIIGSFKSAVSKHVHQLDYDFGWQKRFYDSIIRNDDAYRRITAYIINNPRKWGNDMFNADSQNGASNP